MKTFKVSRDAIKAALTHAPKNDVRFYLNGVCLDTAAGRITATDGARMFVCTGPKEDTGGACYILPRAMCETLAKFKTRYPVDFNVEIDPGTLSVRASFGDEFSIGAKLIDGKFPEWQRVIPQNPSGVLGHYNLEYLADAGRALGIYFGIKPGMYGLVEVLHNGTSACIVHCAQDNGSNGDAQSDAFSIVMPFRIGCSRTDTLADFIACHKPGTARDARKAAEKARDDAAREVRELVAA